VSGGHRDLSVERVETMVLYHSRCIFMLHWHLAILFSGPHKPEPDSDTVEVEK